MAYCPDPPPPPRDVGNSLNPGWALSNKLAGVSGCERSSILLRTCISLKFMGKGEKKGCLITVEWFDPHSVHTAVFATTLRGAIMHLLMP